MPRPRPLGARVLKAVASSLRLQVLNMLLDRGPLSYTEIMNILHLNPSRDAGRFAYHLKSLMKADLIEPDAETKKYRLTDLGRMLVDVTEAIEEQTFKRRRMMVRTSRLAMEEFDRNKIARALVKEAKVPQDLAQKIARETEAKLLEVKAKYLTAPLIREFVNAILIEKGLEEYRHKLTRLGLPVYDVTRLIKSAGTESSSVKAVHSSAGNSVIEEYTLLNALPRDIADAHLSGSLHLNNLGVWILKPSEFAHDVRHFFKHGLQLNRPQQAIASSSAPKSLEAALATITNLLRITATEVTGEQLLDYFNVFLAPFIRGVETDRIRENLRLFLINLNQTLADFDSVLPASFALELVVPDFLGNEKAIGPEGKRIGPYADYLEEARLLATLLMETVLEESRDKPFFQPSLVIKLRPKALQSKECESLLVLAHRLAAERGLPFFANLGWREQACASYSATGTRFSNDWKGDWELDTLRTGTMDSILINLPRLAYESEQKAPRFYERLDEQLEMALRALEIKYQTIKLRAREGLLPFLTHRADGEQYARFENFTRLIGFVGLNQAVESLTGKPLHEEAKSTETAEQIMKHIHDYVRKSFRKPETRVVTAMIPSPSAAKRLAQLDIERYGWARIRVSGNKEQPFYTDLVAVPKQAQITLDLRLKIEERMQQLASGGHLTPIQIEGDEPDPAKLLGTSRKLASDSRIGLHTFSRVVTYCNRCGKAVLGQPAKCPTCGSTDALASYSRASAKYALGSG
ncbi:MAG TPA: anaerobic ribonucleoside-triphosphate reductase [Candidatus Bathyarchaeia archaeon]|nr:anaerobic ribonucleoside-triphosphate reductase [Candidatus Bathyarchaeia archaeon]